MALLLFSGQLLLQLYDGEVLLVDLIVEMLVDLGQLVFYLPDVCVELLLGLYVHLQLVLALQLFVDTFDDRLEVALLHPPNRVFEGPYQLQPLILDLDDVVLYVLVLLEEPLQLLGRFLQGPRHVYDLLLLLQIPLPVGNPLQ